MEEVANRSRYERFTFPASTALRFHVSDAYVDDPVA
jgi:hypothetical protein